MFRFASIYGTGAVLGFSPREIDQMTLWEFAAAVEGWSKANGGESKPEAPSEEEHDRLMAKYS